MKVMQLVASNLLYIYSEKFYSVYIYVGSSSLITTGL